MNNSVITHEEFNKLKHLYMDAIIENSKLKKEIKALDQSIENMKKTYNEQSSALIKKNIKLKSLIKTNEINKMKKIE